MDLRVSVDRKGKTAVVHVDGRLAVCGVDDLDRAVRHAVGPVIVDLSNLWSADDAGVAALRLLMGRRVRLRGVSPYIALLLAREPYGHVGVARPGPRRLRPGGRRPVEGAPDDAGDGGAISGA